MPPQLYGQGLPAASPQSIGLSSARLDSLSSFLKEAGSSAVMVLKDGQVVYAWG